MTAEITIDVSELILPKPMMTILGALAELPDGGQPTVHHTQRPMHLYPRLDEMGYAHTTTELAPNKVELVLTNPVSVCCAHHRDDDRLGFADATRCRLHADREVHAHGAVARSNSG